MGEQYGFILPLTNKMNSPTLINSIAQCESITVANIAKKELNPQDTKKCSNISTQKALNTSEVNFGKQYPPRECIFKQQFDLEYKHNILDTQGALDLSFSQSSQRTVKLNSKSIKDGEIKLEILGSKEGGVQIQWEQGIDFIFDNNTAIDMSLRKNGKEVVKCAKSEENENIPLPNALTQHKDLNTSLAKNIECKTELEEWESPGSHRIEIPPKYEHNANRLVKNPLVLEKNDKCVKKSRNKFAIKGNLENSFDVKLQSELNHLHEDFHLTAALTASAEFVAKQDTFSGEEPKYDSINLNELIIKSESFYTQSNNQENPNRTNLDINYFNNDLNTLLDVNVDTLSNAKSSNDTILNDPQSIQSIRANPDKSRSIIAISSAEHEKISKSKQNSLTGNKLKNNLTKIIRKPYKTRSKTSLRNTNLKASIGKTSKAVRKPKTKQSSKYIKKELPCLSEFLNKNKMKNLPKTTVETTRIKGNNKKFAAKEKFPKPFKLETEPIKLYNVTADLPKPITFKREFETNIGNIELYQQPAFQPLVRLKRLRSEGLLVPLRTKKVRKSGNKDISFAVKHSNYYQRNNDDNKDLIIHQAFSLNPEIKLKRIKNSHSYEHGDQPSLYSRMPTPSNVPNENNNEFWNDSESKYLSTQELFSVFHHATPKHSSMIRGNTDSGVSTSTPSTVHRYDDNINLLLDIAAERAFINNHLKAFGYSPIQFQLYNDFNELNIFLKYLIDRR